MDENKDKAKTGDKGSGIDWNQQRKSPGNEKKSSRLVIIVAVLAIIVIIQGIKIYLDYVTTKEQTQVIINKEIEVEQTLRRLDEIKEELESKIKEIEELGGDIAELEQAKAELQKERDKLNRNRNANRKLITQLKERADGYEALLKAKDEEIKKLRDVNEQLLTENTSLKNTQNQLSDSLVNLSETQEKLEVKVAKAGRLKAENIGVVAINSRGKEKKSPFRKKHAKQLKVSFEIAENEFAPIEGKDIMLRIIDDKQQVIFDVSNGSGTFVINGKEEFYTAIQQVLYDRLRQTVSFVYDKGSDYEPGDYMVEVYAEDYIMGTASFTVK